MRQSLPYQIGFLSVKIITERNDEITAHVRGRHEISRCGLGLLVSKRAQHGLQATALALRFTRAPEASR